MTDARNDIVDIQLSKGGEIITMADGSRWFHPFTGGAPTQVRRPRLSKTEAAT
jgi:hypothetical protein